MAIKGWPLERAIVGDGNLSITSFRLRPGKDLDAIINY